ncbi:hypothetical protein EON65_44360, partial [archaeon]
MLLSGSRSYYDDYLRKKGSGRTLHDPASLLTDRGAYVNFLEVQLERVSAACLNVQSFEERFNDTQTMLRTVEQRIGANTKLITLSQQCTEEVRAETHQRFDHFIKDVNEIKNSLRRSIDSLDIRMSTLERNFSAVTALEQRITELERKQSDDNNQQSAKHTEVRNELSSQAERVFQLTASIQDVSDVLDTVRSTQHFLKYDLKDTQGKQEKIEKDLQGSLHDHISLHGTQYKQLQEHIEANRQQIQGVRSELGSQCAGILDKQEHVLKISLQTSSQLFAELKAALEQHKATQEEDLKDLEEAMKDIQEQGLRKTEGLAQDLEKIWASHWETREEILRIEEGGLLGKGRSGGRG